MLQLLQLRHLEILILEIRPLLPKEDVCLFKTHKGYNLCPTVILP